MNYHQLSENIATNCFRLTSGNINYVMWTYSFTHKFSLLTQTPYFVRHHNLNYHQLLSNIPAGCLMTTFGNMNYVSFNSFHKSNKIILWKFYLKTIVFETIFWITISCCQITFTGCLTTTSGSMKIYFFLHCKLCYLSFFWLIYSWYFFFFMVSLIRFI